MTEALLNLERKMQTLLDYEKSLAKELKKDIHDMDLIKDEIAGINNKIASLEREISLLKQGHKPNELVSYRSFTNREVYEMKKTTSWSQLAAYLKCSVSTCQRMVRAGKEEANGDS